ncbi:MAG: DUF4288 domain-containing protein [Gammaproteobacteria bacterium]
MSYYSARIAVICLVSGPVPEEGYTVDIQVHVFKAEGFDQAKETALSIGQSEEHSYKNQFNEEVEWKFLRIENITHLGDELSRTEVSSRMEAWRPSAPVERNLSMEELCKNVEYFDEAVN